MSTTNDPIACWDDIMARIRLVPELVDKTEPVLSEQDLLAILKGAKFPMAGVIYAGINATGGDPSRQGMASEFTCTILLIVQGGLVGSTADTAEAVRLLRLMREQIRLTSAPGGHKWRFVREAPAGVIGNAVIYKQTWSTVLILT